MLNTDVKIDPKFKLTQVKGDHMTTEITFEQLTQGQQIAFNSTVDAIKTKGQHITINGPAGTGKTTLTKFLISHLIKSGESGIMLSAPTHQAKKVLSDLAGMEAQTIHSLLKINPTTYEDATLFEQKDAPDLSKCRVLICDEVSMYDKELFRILMASVPYWCTIIGLGDIAQIRPVAPNTNVPETSLFFLNPKFKQVSLTEVMRSNAPIIEVATEIRNGKWIRESLIGDVGVHNMILSGGGSVANFMKKYFEIVKTPDDLFNTRMLAYTNSSVNNLNKIIRQKLYETKEPFIKDEVLVMQEPFIRSHTFEGKSFSEVIFNNGELIRIDSCYKGSKNLSIKSIEQNDVIECWYLDCTSLDSGATASIVVIENEKEMNKFQFYLSSVASIFKAGNTTGKRPNWKGWWELRNKFHKVKALPCGTIHKSQGSSVDNVFLYTPCIHKADLDLAQQLLYVSTTRARHNVYYI